MFKKFSVIALLLGFSSLVVANISEPAAQKKVILVIHDTSFGKGFLEMYQALKSKGHDVKVLAIPFLEEDNSVIIDIDMSYIILVAIKRPTKRVNLSAQKKPII
jgi:hypothetical protein